MESAFSFFWEPAEEICRRAIAIDPGDARAHYLLGNAILLAKKSRIIMGNCLSEVEAAYRIGLQHNPESARTYLELGDFLNVQNAMAKQKSSINKRLKS